MAEALHDSWPERLAKRDETVLREIANSVGLQVYRWLCSGFWGKLSCEDIEEVVQNTVLQIWKSQYNYSASFSTWFHNIALHKALDRWNLRKRRVRCVSVETVDAHTSASVESTDTPPTSDAGDSSLGPLILRLRVHLAELSPTQRTIAMAYAYHYPNPPSVKALAKELQMKEGTVRNHWFRIKARIAKAFPDLSGPA